MGLFGICHLYFLQCFVYGSKSFGLTIGKVWLLSRNLGGYPTLGGIDFFLWIFVQSHFDSLEEDVHMEGFGIKVFLFLVFFLVSFLLCIVGFIYLEVFLLSIFKLLQVFYY